MKKFIAFCFLMIAATVCGTVQAEVDRTFGFVDKDGKVIADRAVLTVTKAEVSDFGDVQLNSGLWVKNNTASAASLVIKYNITQLDNGKVEVCFPSSCSYQTAVGEYSTSPGEMAGSITQSLASEWFPVAEKAYGKCTVIYTIVPVKITNFVTGTYDVLGEGAKVTVNYKYGAGAVRDIEAGDASIEAIYTVTGQRVDKFVPGVNIVKLSNGKTIKRHVSF